jgi:glutaredoxin-like YruB-family protein
MIRQVKVYSTPNCPWCKKAKQFLQSNDILFNDLDVASDKAARDEMIKKTGQLAVPVIEIDGEITVGYDENWLRQKLGLIK